MLDTTKRMSTAIVLAAASLALTACGNGNSILKDADLAVTLNNNQQLVEFTAEIDPHDVTLAAATLPIMDHQNPPHELGKVEILFDVTTNKPFLKLTANMGEILNIPTPTLSSLLPNGTTIPLMGIDLMQVMAFDVGANGSRVYVYYNEAEKKALIGVALNVAGLTIGQTANAFVNYSFPGVTGIAGLYFGPTISGLGAFANLSDALFPSLTSSPVAFQEMSLTPDQQEKVFRLYQQVRQSGQPIQVH